MGAQGSVPVIAPGFPAGVRWYVGHTLPRKEDVARINLERQGLTVFLPQILVPRRHARRRYTVKAPFFPRYLFIQLDLAHDRWRTINGTLGMSHLVMADEHPSPVPHGIVDALIAAADGNCIRPAETLRTGDPVRLVGGPFAGELGVFLRADSKGRVEMLLKILNGSVRLTVARDFLEAAG